MAPWRRSLPVLVALAALASGIWFGRVTAQTPEPGSSADPLVTKSYVDQVRTSLQEAAVSKAYIDEMTTFRVVTVPAGQAIIGGSGTEIVLRGGQATAITTEQGGLLNTTSGADMKDGEEIPSNHLLVVPRDDGRGLQAVTDLVLMVKGQATVGPKN